MKKEKLSSNLIMQFFYQGVTLVIPLIISPFLTRTLGSSSLGIYTYTYSIAYYFVMLAMLGISRHGQRIISQNRDDEMKLRKVFWSLFFTHIVVSLVSFVLFLLFSLAFGGDDRVIYLIQSLYVLSALFNITWLFYGLENFKSVVLRNTVVKAVECLLIFLLIRTPDDLWKYTLISAGGILAGQAVMLPQAVAAVRPVRFGWEDVRQHIKPLLVFSISVIAVSLYTVFDKTLLGIMTVKDNVAYYEYSNKIITILVSLIGAVGTVMYPRACAMAAKKDFENQRKYINYSFFLVSMIAFGAMFGLLAVAKEFAVFYYGEHFSACGSIIIAMCPLVYIIGMGDILRTQYMIPNHMDIHFNVCILMSAVVNLILSFLLIPKIGIFGAVAGTASAELFGFIYQLTVCRSFIRLRDIVSAGAPFLLIGTVMYAAVRVLQRGMERGLMSFLVQVAAGAFVYGTLSLIYVFWGKRELMNLVLEQFIKKKK